MCGGPGEAGPGPGKGHLGNECLERTLNLWPPGFANPGWKVCAEDAFKSLTQ